ncbi:MAG: pilus assembly protein [Peptococcaceae bacterium]|nr:pilus assembly protein [Peptococcaceae bacterium]
MNVFTAAVKNPKGSILLEFVLAMTILIVIFLATVTFSFLYADYYSLQKVARDGAREAGITMDTDRAIQKMLESAWLWGLDLEKLTVDFSLDGTAVTCYVTYTSTPFHRKFLTPLKGKPLEDVTMNARATFINSGRK